MCIRDRNTIALSYKELEQYDEAIRCYDEVIGSSIEAGNKAVSYTHLTLPTSDLV